MNLHRISAVLLCLTLFLHTLHGVSFAQVSQAGNELPPYEENLLRLVAIVGSLEFLHPLCNRQQVGVWKDQMANLLEAEEPTLARRARMLATYNKAYSSLQQVHRSCTPNVSMILERYEAEAIELTRLMATTYRPTAPKQTEEAAGQQVKDDSTTTTDAQ